MLFQPIQVAGGGAALLLSSLAIAGLSLFFQKCMEPGMIFRRYYLWLTRLWMKNWRRKDRWKRKFMLLQVLGLCVYCNSFWVSLVFSFLFFGLKWEMILFPGLTFLWIELIRNKIQNT
jgi:hypothetical protein